jgi:O-antigen chain-terminating methyltransferase
VRPVHPETLRFLLGAVGFREVENRFISPILDDARLKKMEAEEGMNDLTKQLIETCNRNIEMLNVNLYGAQDFAMIGKK